MKENYQKSNKFTDTELSKQVFHLKTLCDVSHVLLDQENIESTLRNFLLMTLGSFGVVEGFAYIHEEKSLIPRKIIAVGVDKDAYPQIEKGCNKLLVAYDFIPSMEQVNEGRRLLFFPRFIAYVSIFNIAYACNGIVGLGAKIMGDSYTDEEKELMETLIINLAVTLKNVRSTQALKSAFREVNRINQAKTKVINHLSHELKTPISLLKTALSLLRKPLSDIPREKWIRTYERANRSLKRLSGIQREAEDIMRERVFPHHHVVTGLLNECSDVLESLTTEQMGEGDVVEKIRKRIDELYLLDDQTADTIHLGHFVGDTLAQLELNIQHRDIHFSMDIEASKSVSIPKRILSTIVTGVLKNAIENTPDQGRIDISVKDSPKGVDFIVQDFGTGILAKDRKHIFSGFYPTQATDTYSTKKPFDFNAGGKGADLMRMKIYSERYHFKLGMTSTRCRYLPSSSDTCPGTISACDHCEKPEDCCASGTTTFHISFPSDNRIL